LVIGGIVLALAAARGLGSALTATPVPISGAGLRTSGAYGFVRHPIYSALLLATLGLLLAMGSIWSWIWGAVILVFFWTKSRWEDRLLHEEYGAAWATWARTTGALVPRPSRLARRS
jgi:protein-S-isoprenylcysteine O-methyltransferase Ste14